MNKKLYSLVAGVGIAAALLAIGAVSPWDQNFPGNITVKTNVLANGVVVTNNLTLLNGQLTPTDNTLDISDGTDAINAYIFKTVSGADFERLQVGYSSFFGGYFIGSDAGGAGSHRSLTLYGNGVGLGINGTGTILSLDASGSTLTGRSIITGTAAGVTPLTITQPSLTGAESNSIVNLSTIWNTTGTPSALKVVITNTASGGSSKAIELLGGAAGTTALFSVTTSGTVAVAGSISAGGNVTAGGSSLIGWGDTFLFRDGAANNLQLGQDAASASAQIFKGPDGTGTDGTGGSLTITGGNSTGTGRAGSVIIRTAGSSNTSGSSANVFNDRARYVPKFVALTDNTATTLFTVTLPATNCIGISFTCTVQAGDGTDFQSLTTPVTIDAVAKVATITTVVAPTAAQTALAGSAGTLSVTYTVVDNGSNVLAVKATADTSFGSPTYLRARIVMTGINIMGAGTVINEI